MNLIKEVVRDSAATPLVAIIASVLKGADLGQMAGAVMVSKRKNNTKCINLLMFICVYSLAKRNIKNLFTSKTTKLIRHFLMLKEMTDIFTIFSTFNPLA